MLRVMVVDDNDCVRHSICLLLKTYPDIEVVCIGADGTEAVTKAGEYRPDVILMDIGMPTMNGLEATKIIKREMPSIQIIVVSGEGSLQEALSAGASGYLVKSEVSEHLIEEVRKFKPTATVTLQSPQVATPDQSEWYRLAIASSQNRIPKR